MVSFEDDSPAIKEEDGKPKTIDHLIEKCLLQFENGKDESFSKVFFRTYRWYISTTKLLQTFIDRLTDPANTIKEQNLVYRAVRCWLLKHGCDFEKNEEAKALLNEINEKAQEKLNNGTVVSIDLDDWYEAKRTKNLQRGETRQTRSTSGSLSFNEMSGASFADILHFIAYKGIRKIPLDEWKTYGKSAKTKETPLLKDMICLFNDISKYVIAMVLSHGTAVERAKTMHKFIDMARRLMELQDYNGLMAVVGGLGHSAVTRLYKTKDLLSPEDKLFIKETHEFLSSNQNYLKYRSTLEKAEGFLIPVIGIVMKDLVALETAVGDFIHEGEMEVINFHKMLQLSTILEQVLVSRELNPMVEARKEFLHIVRVSLKSRYTEDDLYDMSLEREPRDHRMSTLRTGSVNTSQVFFAEWAAGEIPEIPNRDTVEKHVRAMVKAVFKTYDVDKNGSINKEEFEELATNFPIIDTFAVIDVNCDGSISEQEMLNYFMNANAQEMTKEFVHEFQEHSFYSPHYCVYCLGFLWGIGKSGYRCKNCHISCHKECKSHVVMECKPVRRTQSLKDMKTGKANTLRRRLRPDWKGSTDSQFSSDFDPPSPTCQDRDVFVENGSPTIRPRQHDMRVRERVLKLEMDNEELRTQLKDTESAHSAQLAERDALIEEKDAQIAELKAQLGLVRQQSVKFMLDQMERLNGCQETDV